MKNLFAILVIVFLGIQGFAQSAVGVWKTIDDETGKEKSHVQIYEQNGELYGKVIKLLDPTKQNMKCTSCKGSKKNQKVIGMNVIEGMEADATNEWDDGTITDPNKGKVYDCSMKLVDKNTLEVRGYMGWSLLGRSQTWYRVK